MGQMWGYNISWLAHMGIRGGEGCLHHIAKICRGYACNNLCVYCKHSLTIPKAYWVCALDVHFFWGGKHRLGQLVQTNKDGFNFHSSSKRGGTHVEPKTH